MIAMKILDKASSKEALFKSCPSHTLMLNTDEGGQHRHLKINVLFMNR
jgi:hypothetical protein